MKNSKKIMVKSRSLKSVELLVQLPLPLRLYAWPFALLYALWLVLFWAGCAPWRLLRRVS